jgi:hypothetical protein
MIDPRLPQLGIVGPAIPLVFRSTRLSSTTTVFGARGSGARGLAFYLFDEPSDAVYRFEQDRPPRNASAEEFVETANWNRMTYLGFTGEEHRNLDIKRDGFIGLRDLDKSEVRLLPLLQSAFFLIPCEQSPWAFEPRVLQDPFAHRLPTVDTVLRSGQCFFLPETHLPENWSCNWERQPISQFRPIPLLSELQSWFHLPAPLRPIMFKFGNDTTIFESQEIFYVYDVALRERKFIPALYRFAGRFKSVEDFLEQGDWSQMERLTYNPDLVNRSELSDPHHSPSVENPKQRRNLVLRTGGGFRPATERP